MGRRGRLSGWFAVLPLAVLVLAPPASASSPLVVVSGPSPFPTCATDGTLQGVVVNAEVEPWLVVNPTDPGNIVVGWQQDRWGYPNEGGAHGLATWSSLDGGQTGTESYAAFTGCSGGTAAGNGDYDRASDVWLTAGPDGTLYQAALVFDWSTGRNGVTVSRSTDKGGHWSTPVVVDRSNRTSFTKGDDKESITADPTHPGWVYAVWDRYSNQYPNYSDGRSQNSNKGPAYFSRSTDGGLTWSDPMAIYARNNGTLGNQIVVLPDGTLLDVFLEYVVAKSGSGSTAFYRLSSLASHDHGATWSSKATVISDSLPDSGTYDPDDPSLYLRSGGLFDLAVAPDGRVYAVAQTDLLTPGQDRTVLWSSTDGGTTWSTPSLIADGAPPSQQFTPSVDVNADGVVAVNYYDFRNFVSGSGTLATDFWATTSSDHGATWSADQRLTATSFDALEAPPADGPMVGDYEGLDHSGSAFWAAFEIVNDGQPTNSTDIVVRSFTP